MQEPRKKFSRTRSKLCRLWSLNLNFNTCNVKYFWEYNLIKLEKENFVRNFIKLFLCIKYCKKILLWAYLTERVAMKSFGGYFKLWNFFKFILIAN